jgi:hypothetical protein
MKLNGSGARKLSSWIEAFVADTENTEAPTIYRQWSAIATIGAVLEQKVWLQTSSTLYPNLYVFLVGHPGVGKTRSIRAARNYAFEVPEFHLAPTSVTAASLVDALVDLKRTIIQPGLEATEYNTMMVTSDELGTFMAKYDEEFIALMCAFYDVDLYSQWRRGKELKIKIRRPQISMLCGTTPANLMRFVPEQAWDGGFMSRTFLIWSDDRNLVDIFEAKPGVIDKDLLHDLRLVNMLGGQYNATKDFRDLLNSWREANCHPAPSHPRLLHYNSRRSAHLLKLSMISAADRDAGLLLTRADFDRAYQWLTSAEALMPDIFKAGAPGADAHAIEEILHFISTVDKGKGVPEQVINRFAMERLPLNSIPRVIAVMVSSGMIKRVGEDKTTGMGWYRPT